jgi:decaprenyl-phosphate phosphoribosyltransferase
MAEQLEMSPASAVPLALGSYDDTVVGVRRLVRFRGLARALRPRQWAKNVLVLAAPTAGGVMTHPTTVALVATAFVGFCLAASATYLPNDVVDRDEDRLHPDKRARPVAAGLVPPALALSSAAILACCGLVVAALAAPGLALALLSYLALTTLYSLGLRRVAVIELGVVASGFVIRVIAGGLATGVPVSQWLLIVVSFGALFVVAGKRYGDLASLDEAAGRVRITLRAYTLGYLRFVAALAAAVMLVAYCLWAFAAGVRHGTLAELSVLPLTLAILRYGLLLETGQGGAPEEVLLRDLPLLALSLTWAAVYGLGIYLG